MNRLRIVLVLFVASATLADTPVTVEVKETGSDQIAYARDLANQVARAAPGEAEQTARFRAIIAYRAVVEHWPREIASVIAAGLAESDLWLQGKDPAAAVSILERLLPVVAKSDNEPAVYRRLGVAYHRMNRVKDAEQAFTRAEASPALARHALLAVQTFRESALFYERTGRHAQSAIRYEKLSRLEHVDVRSRALAAMDAVRTSMHANDRGAAGNHFAHAEKLVRLSAAAHRDAAATQLERELERLRAALK
jgi:tetratricopeptide (TPR) repeat protein